MNISQDTRNSWTKSQLTIAIAVCTVLLLLVILVDSRSLKAGKLGATSLQLLYRGKPVPGAFIAVDYYQGVTDEMGRISVELFPGTYEVEIQPSKGSSPIIVKTKVEAGQKEVVLELERIQGQVKDPKVPKVLVLARFDKAEDFIQFWRSETDAARQALGGMKAVVLQDGGYAVVRGGPPLQSAKEIGRLTEQARNAGFASSLTVAEDAVAAVLIENGELDMNRIADTLFMLLESNDAGTRRNARITIGNLGPKVAPELVKMLNGRNYRRDLGAMVALGEIREWHASPEDFEKLWKAAGGYKGDRVIQSAFFDALQSAHTDGKLEFLGYKNDQASVMKFQKQNGLSSDGRIGPQTHGKLNELVYAKLRRQSGLK